MTPRFSRVLAVTAAALTLAACVGDGDELITDVVNAPANGATNATLFNRYVSLGNSITAGFQSGGLVDSLQLRAYPVLLAQRAGIPSVLQPTTGYGTFVAPLFRGPGCPVPFVGPLTPSTTPNVCTSPVRSDVLNSPSTPGNYAVPGAKIADLMLPVSANAQLNLQINGIYSQVHRMLMAHPTFVSAWAGNNDALGAALSGSLGPAAAGADSALTRLAPFTASLAVLVDSIAAAGPQGVMLVGVVNPGLAPLLQPGAYFFLARDPATGAFQGKPVNANCSPVTALGTPNPLAANLVSFQIITNANFPEINCDPAAYPVGDPRRGVYLLDTAEQALVTTRVNEYNAAIQAAATARNWVFVNPNAVLAPFLAERTSGRAQRIRKCQDLATATTAAAFQAAVLNTCPVTGPTAAPNFFGSLISFDGVHPSSEAHRILAGSFAAAINARYGSSLSTSTN